MHDSNGLPLNDLQMSEQIHDVFANVGADLANTIHVSDPIIALPPVDMMVDDNVLMFDNIESDEVKKYHKSICIYISSRVWKTLFNHFSNVFANFYNQIVNNGEFLNKWKIATVVSIPKITHASSPNDLRPISLLPLPGEILEHILHKLLMNHLEVNNLINPCQNGFRPKRSTIQTVFEYTTDLYKKLNTNQNTTTIYTNLRKAFDTVSHEILLNKLKTFKICEKYQNVFRNYLSNRHQCTLINNSISELKPVPCGVRQGSVLGLTFLLLYINDVVNVIEKCSCYLYADDMVIYRQLNNVNSLGELQADMDSVYDCCNRNILTINIEKTKAQLFPKNSNNDPKQLP